MPRIPSLAFAVALLLASAASAFGHAFPTSTDPLAGSTLKTAPTEVVIDFTEELELHFSGITVLDAHGTRVDKNDAHLAADNAKRLIADLGRLAPGTYKVVWHATSVDTHKTDGTYRFTVAP